MKNRHPKSSEPVENKEEELEVTKSDFILLKYILWGGAFSLLILLVVFYMVIYFYLNPYVKKELIRTINQSTDSLYVMDIDQLHIRFFRSSIDVKDARLVRNPKKWKEVKKTLAPNSSKDLDIDFEIHRLEAKGIRWLAYLRTGELEIEQISLIDPKIHLYTHAGYRKAQNPASLPEEVQNFVASFAQSFGLKKLLIENLELDLSLKTPRQETLHQGHQMSFELIGLDIQTDSTKKPIENINFEDFKINSKSYEYQATGNLHKLRVGAFNLSSKDSLLSLKDLELEAEPPKDSLNKETTEKKEALLLDLKAKELNATKADFKRIIYKQEFDLGNLNLNDLDLKVDYHPGIKKPKDKNTQEAQAAVGEEPAPQAKKQLKDILRELPFYVAIDTFRIRDAALKFNQFDKKGEKVLTYHHIDSINLAFCHVALGKAITKELNNRALYSQSVELRLNNYAYQTPNGVYKMFIEEAFVSSIDSLLEVKGAEIIPLVSPEAFSQYTQYQELLIKARIDKAQATHLDIERMAYRQEFSMDMVYLDRPVFGAYLDKRKPKRPGQQFQNLEEVLKSIPLFIQIRVLGIRNASVNYREQTDLNEGKGFAEHKAEDINLQIQSIALGRAFDRSALAEIDTKSLLLSIDDYEYLSPDGLYQISLDQLDVSSSDSYISIDSLQITPLLNNEQFAETQIYSYEIIRISADNIQGREIDFKKLLLYQEVDWGYLHLDYPRIQIYADKRKPKRPPKRDSLRIKHLQRLKMLDKDTSSSKSRLLVKLMDLYKDRISSEESISKDWIKKKLPFNLSKKERSARLKDTEKIRKQLLSYLAYPALPTDSTFKPILASEGENFYDDERSYRNLTDTTGLRRLLREIPAYIKIDTFEVNQATVIYREHSFAKRGSGVAYHYSDSINFIVPQIRLGRATEDSTFRHFYSGNFLLTMRTYLFKDKEDQFLFTLRGIESSLRDSTLLAKQLEVRPLSNKEAFVAENPYRSTYINAKLQSIRADAIDIDRLVFDQEFVLNSLYIKQPFLDLYTDTRKPRRPGYQSKTAEQLLQSIPIHIKIDSFAIDDASLKFGSLVKLPNQKAPGLAQHSLGHIDISAEQVELALDKASRTRKEADNLLYSGKIVFDLQDYQFTTPDKRYQISFDSLHSSLNDSLVLIQKLKYKPLWDKEQFDTLLNYRATRLDLEVDDVRAVLADIRGFLNNTAYDLHLLNFNEVKLNLYQNQTLKPKPNLPKKSLQEIVRGMSYMVKVDTINVNNAQVNFTEKINVKNRDRTRENQHYADSIYVSLHNVVIDSAASQDKILFSDDIQLSLRNYSTKTADSLYQISLDKIEGSTLQSFIRAQGFEMKPTVPDFTFTYIKKYQTDRFKFKIKDIETRAIDFPRLINSQELFLNALRLDGLNIDIYRDKRADPNPNRVPSMPHQAFKKIPISLKVDTIRIQNGEAVYKERVPKGVGTGKVFFTKINGDILGLDTRDDSRDTTLVKIEGLLMDEGKIEASLKIPLNADSLYCKYQGRLGAMDATFFNSMIESNEHVRIRKGLINEVDFDVALKDTLATGTLSAGYKRLKIQVLNEEDHRKKRGFLTFLANLILKSRNNIDRKRYKVGEVYYDRQEKDGFMKILWKSLSTGLVDTLK